MRHAHGLLESKEYDKGLADAWEAARKVNKLKAIERMALFETVDCEVIMSKNPSEVIQKLIEFEANGKAKEEETFKVGDVIRQVSTSGKETGLVCVVRSYENGVMRGISTEGKTVICSAYTERYWRKTGIHFSNIFIIHKQTEGEPE